MLAVAIATPARNMSAMSPRRMDSATEMKMLGRALSVLRKRADLSQAAAAERIGVTPQAWQRYEAGERQALLRTDLQERLATALGFTRQDLVDETSHMVDDRRAKFAPLALVSDNRFAHLRTQLPIRDQVQAGAWLAVDDLDQGPPRTFPAAPDPRFAKADQWISQVFGDSMDLVRIFEGDAAQFVDAVQIGYHPRSGDIVEVERTRWNGQLRELTIKQVEVAADGGVTLWPRSANPRWQDPLKLTSDTTDGEEFEVRIRGLLVAVIRRF